MCGTKGAGLPVSSKATRYALAASAACFGAAGFGAPAFAAGTVAGTNITATATATYQSPGSGTTSVDSNTVSLTVDELLDVAVALASPGDVMTSPGATDQVIGFSITNAGNGNERLRLATREAIGGDQFDPANSSIVLDSNGNGAYDAGTDSAYVAGSNDPVLAADASLGVFILSSIPAGAANDDRGLVLLWRTG